MTQRALLEVAAFGARTGCPPQSEERSATRAEATPTTRFWQTLCRAAKSAKPGGAFASAISQSSGSQDCFEEQLRTAAAGASCSSTPRPIYSTSSTATLLPSDVMSSARLRFGVFRLLMLTLAGASAFSADAETANDQRARIERLEDAVLAPCCYSEPVSKHQSEVAVKMRLQIAKWVAEGRTDREILGAYVDQYGARVLVDPRTKPAWWAPWIPWLAVMLAMGFGFWLLRQWQAKPVPAAPASIGPELAELPDFDDEP